MSFQVFGQFLDGACAVAYFVLDIQSKFCEGEVVLSVGHEHGIVAESLGAAFLGGDGTIDDAFKESLLSPFDEGYGRAETGGAVGLVGEFAEEFQGVGLGVVSVGEDLAGRVYTGAHVESRHLQTCVVGKDVKAVAVEDKVGLLQGVAFQRGGRFGNVLMATDVGEGEDFYITVKHGTHLF